MDLLDAIAMEEYWDGPEVKNLDSNSTNTLVGGTATANFNVIVMPQQGFTQNQRIGREIADIEVEWVWDGHVAVTETGASPISLRFVVDVQPHETAAAITDIYVADQMSSLLNLDNEGRFIELERCDYGCINKTKGAWATAGQFSVADRMKLQGAGGAFGNMSELAVYTIVYQNGGLLVTAVDTLNIRVNYTG